MFKNTQFHSFVPAHLAPSSVWSIAVAFALVVAVTSCSGGQKKSVTPGEADPTPHVVEQPTTDTGDSSGAGSTGGGVTAPGSYFPTLVTNDSTVRSGESAEITLTLKDASGAPYSKAGLLVVFETAGGTSTGTLSPTQSSGPGIYKTNFTGIVAGTPLSITATVSGARVSTSLPSIIVLPGPVSGITSTVLLTQTTLAAGNAINFRAIPRDAVGNLYVDDDLTVSFNLTNGSSTGIIGAPVRQDDGSFLSSFTGQTAGSPAEVRALLNSTISTDSAPTVTVTPGIISAANSILAVSSSTVASGANVTISLQAKDSFNNNLVVGGATVVFSTGAGTSSGTLGSVTDNGNGTYSALFTGQSVGSARTIQAAINGNAITTTLPEVTVTPGTVSLVNSTIAVSGATVASGSTRTITLTALDAFGNNLTAGGLTVTFARTGGSSTGTFAATTDVGNGTYTSLFTGVISGSATSITAQINAAPVSSASPTVLVTPGPFSLSQSSIVVSSSSIASGSVSNLTLTTRDAAGNNLTSGGSTVIFSGAAGTSTGTFAATTDLANGQYTSTFTGVIVGTARAITGSINGSAITSISPSIVVTPGTYSLASSTITTSAPTVAAGNLATFSMQARDLAGNATNTSGLTVLFSLPGGQSDGTIGTTSYSGNGLYVADFTAENAGNAVTILATSNAVSITGPAATITVTPGVADVNNTLVTVSAPTVASAGSVNVTLVAFDSYGNQLANTDGVVVFTFDGGVSTGVLSATSALGSGVYRTVLTGIIAGSASDISATYDGQEILSSMPSVQVLVGPISTATSTLTVSSPTVQSGSVVTLTLKAKDANGNLISSGGALIAFNHTGGESSGTIGSTLDLGTGSYTADFIGDTSGSATTITASIGGTPITTTLPTIEVIPGPPFTFEVFGHTGGTAGVASNFTVRTRDLNGNTVEGYVGTVHFTSTDPQASLPANYKYTGADDGVHEFSGALLTAGTHSITATDTLNALVTGTQAGIAIAPATSSKLYFGGPQSSKVRMCSDAIQVGVMDAFNNISSADAPVSVTLGGVGAGSFYSDALCSTPISNTTIALSSQYTNVYFSSDLEGALVHSATDVALNLTAATVNFDVKPWAAWVGSDASIAHFEAGINSARGREDGLFNSPVAVEVDDASHLYVADASNHKIHKFDRSNDTYIGWIGKIGVAATGGEPGCSGAPINTTTPGWCTGGRTATSTLTGNGMYNAPQSIYYYNSHIYIVDMTNHRIQKINSDTGAFVGWIGRILTSPTGGDVGCSGAAVGSFTPGWCSGGTAQLSAASAVGFSSPRYIVGDATNLIIADAGNHRLIKVNIATGQYLGWFGRASVVPTGGAAGCTGIAANAVTPGWCTGGTSALGNLNGAFSTPRGMKIIGSKLYVADSGNHRIQRIDLVNDPLIAGSGWIGRITTTPTGGDAGCAGAAVNSFTPGWCLGGSATTGTGNGNFNTPYRVTGDATYLYVGDYGNQRTQRFGTTAPTFQGWAGRILTSPTGGQAGCTGAPINTATPGWCTGGTATFGYYPGMRYSSQGLELIDGALYVSDSANQRVEKLDPANGTHLGSLGAQANGAASWSVKVVDVHTGAFDDKSFYAPTGLTVAGGSLYVADSINHRIKKMNITSGAFEGWIGSVSTPASGGTGNCTSAAVSTFPTGWCTGGNTKTGTGNGMLNAPQDVFEYAGNLYVADGTNHRISRYTVSTGAFTGWIGYVNTAPTGGVAGCSGLAANNPTPGWCTGGTSKTGSVSGAFNVPTNITGDGTYLYITDKTNNRVVRASISTGAHFGWVGRIGTSPTGGDAGCSGAAVGTFTPGWCTGGTAAASSADGNLSGPKGITYYGGNLYVVDTVNHRVSRYTAATGAFTGWMGRVNTTPTGGSAGCAGTAVSAFTPGWCTGGTAKLGSNDGHLSSPGGIFTNGTSLYVVDVTNNRVSRYNMATAAFTGWMGNVSTATTGGDSGCAGTQPNNVTPGWCTGGTAKYGKDIGMLDAPQFISGAGLYVYVTDSNNSRVMRFPQ